ncbi:MAG: hypothetical protein M3Y73_18650 [Actinomycetota bacterium]|nr:hypothetical protein [Actinomycetota bacterium]
MRTIAGAAPTSAPIGALERWRVAWHGRRDAQHQPAETDHPHPYLDSLRAHAEIGQRTVSEWLHSKIDPIDREAVQVPDFPEYVPDRDAQGNLDPIPAAQNRQVIIELS